MKNSNSTKPDDQAAQSALEEDLTQTDIETLDSCDDETRRALLAKIARIGSATVPASMVLLSADKARANTGPSTGGVISG